MIEREKELEQIKSIDPEDILTDLGIKYKKLNGYYICHIPWKEHDKNPSMSVFRNRIGYWKWKDHTTGESGTWIDLYMKIMKSDYINTVKYLRDRFRIEERKITENEIKNTENIEETKEWKIRDIEEKPLQNKRILEFLRQERKIEHIPEWLKQIHYTKINVVTGETKKLYAFGVKDILGNYHVRMASNEIKEFVIRRHNIGSTYTIIEKTKENNKVIIVEGFIDGIRIDYLYPTSDIVILNGVTNTEKILHMITKYDNIGIATDNDIAGENAAGLIITTLQNHNKKTYRFRFSSKDIDEAIKKKEKIQIIKFFPSGPNINI